MNKLCIQMQAKPLSTLVAGLLDSEVDELLISGLSDDTRQLQIGDAFLCLPRAEDVGLLVQQAEQAGAAAVIFVANTVPTSLPHVSLTDMDALAICLRRWFETENSSMPCIGITGTDGKTSTAWMLREVLALHLGSAWSCGTLGLQRTADDIEDLGNTTPSLLTLHSLFALAMRENIGALVLEVSSHGIAQQRIAGLPFTAAIWTTIGKDHLEDHGGFEAYLACKAGFVQQVANAGGQVVANADYPLIQQALTVCSDNHAIAWYAKTDVPVDFKAMPAADFHAENLAAIRLLMQQVFDVSAHDFVSLCDGHITTPAGRLQPVGKQIFIDYAHTAEGLKRCLMSARMLTLQRLLLVFGCGGDRDKSKRPLMGKVAMQYADVCWLTSDNPRSESQSSISDDVVAGLAENEVARLHVCADRKLAISQAVAALTVNDVLVVAGKGHETYMEIQGEKRPWSDEQTIVQALAFAQGETSCV
ncbi:MAG: UDP-N-acetylmuramoyl-L-alanyl-D-glutamate--2,6-diaminopimelate ligase [Mariprofundaceae bacterium]|nr:UDP-N-acetylmuramoyl-L-alanyl-D-glutamate--2,6-diaminopimelate ligase [Mariprofundaceae bacterium]